ncbi:hypothetical protein GALL_299320 [mine drainage metagenome]|uniref:DUF4232 domain-containing protein n=1 Tax=mine drainage metagenome TaxID=410659 RepID=A0A1J5R829_9ZZZZ
MTHDEHHHHTIASALLRTGLVAGIVVTLAACTAAGSSGGATSSTSAPATVTTPASPAAPTTSAPSASASASASTSASSPGIPPCATSALTGAVDLTAASGAAGSTFYPLDLTNTSGSTCSLEGYPGVSFVTGPSGTEIGDPARRNPVTAPTTVTLDAGHVAHATLQVSDAGNYDQTQCMPVMAHYLRIYPPGQTAALVVPFTTQACSATLPASIGGQLGITVMQPGAS